VNFCTSSAKKLNFTEQKRTKMEGKGHYIHARRKQEVRKGTIIT
jgi:hypothetical protein